MSSQHSQHSATNLSRKKLVTYGMPSRKRRIDNNVLPSKCLSSTTRQEETESTLDAAILGGIKAQRGHPEPVPLSWETQPSCHQNDDARKKWHSTAFDVTAVSDAQSLPPRKPSSLSRHPRRSHESNIRRDGHSKSPSRITPFPTSERTRPSPTRPVRKMLELMDTRNLSRKPKHDLDEDSQDERKATPRPIRRRRLIDALAAQTSKTSETGNHDSGVSLGSSAISSQDGVSPLQLCRFQIHSPSRRIEARGATSTGKKIKFTYSQSRSILPKAGQIESSGANGFLDELDEMFDRSPGRMSTPPRSSSPLDEVEDEDDKDTKHKIQSVHELRRAGAKNRFSDEVDDLLSRIGSPSPSPSTMRRNGLCELVHMLQKDDFASQFRDHTARDKIAKDIQDEKDIIGAFALAAVLVIFLSSSLAPHLLRQLSDDGIGLWLGNLIAVQDDITVIAARRSANVSKATRSSLDGVKKILMQMPIWHNHDMLNLSPRTVALQLLTILIRSSDAQYLLQIIADSSHDIANLTDYYSHQGSTEDLDFAFVISVLEAQSSLAALTNHPLFDVQRQASGVARFLEVTLRRWPQQRTEMDAILLKLATNTTNNETGVGPFSDALLLSNLADCIFQGFSCVKSAMRHNRFDSLIFDELLLILGILINIVEHCEQARVLARGKALESLVTMWSDNQTLMNEADSVEKSKLSIALGYLAVLLGYLFLSPSSMIGAMPGDHSQLPSIGDLVVSIQGFIVMYKSVDNKVQELEGLVGKLRQQDQWLERTRAR